ncbi:CRISPR-associated RAMP protein [Chloroflexia bacterium SDU3-3]|nr:CRISPR-associated RAMP protein [Chloroflexia bacterium SDU3-3]
MESESIFSFAALQNRLSVRGMLVAQTALRIGAGRSLDVIGSDLPVLRDVWGTPYVPGASLKGAFRAQIEALIRTVQPEQVRDFHQLEEHERGTIAPLVQSENNEKKDKSKEIWNESTLIDLTFGAPWVAGRIFFKDALVDRSIWFDQFEIRNGVALNRDTETAEQGLLYDYEVVPAGVRFHFELRLENAAPWQLGMVLLALRPWQQGGVQIGGFRSRGLGYVQLDELSAVFQTIKNANDVLALLGYGDGSMLELPLSAPDDVMQTWFAAFRAALMDPTGVISQGANHA